MQALVGVAENDMHRVLMGKMIKTRINVKI